MSSFATEFHATPEEVTELVAKWLEEHCLIATAEAFPPSRIMPLNRDNLGELLARPEVNEVLFTETQVTIPGNSISDVLKEHPGGLVFQFGRLRSQGLEQSTLSTMNASPLWKRLNAELKKLTTAGAHCIWEDGRTAFDRNARFTAGAKALAATGVPLRESYQSTYIFQPK